MLTEAEKNTVTMIWTQFIGIIKRYEDELMAKCREYNCNTNQKGTHMSNDAQQKALERWLEYDTERGGPFKGPVSRGIGHIFANNSLVHAEDHCIGWAHRELVRRGYTILLDDDSNGLFGWHFVCRIRIYNHSTPKDPFPTCEADTLLDCYLDAIKATEPGKEATAAVERSNILAMTPAKQNINLNLGDN